MARLLTVNRAIILAIAVAAAGFCYFGSIQARSAEAALIGKSPITGYLWSSTAGWISMSCTNGGTCATSEYGVFFDTAKAKHEIPGDNLSPIVSVPISGFAWSSAMGWICFGITCDTLFDPLGQPIDNPEGTPENYAEWHSIDRIDTQQGRIYGWARLVNMGNAGWISLNCNNRLALHTVCPALNPTDWPYSQLTGAGQIYYPTLDAMADPATFCEAGTCSDPNHPSHYSWSGNSDGTGLGWIDWSLAESHWVPPTIKRLVRPAGIYEPASSAVAGVHPSTFEFQVQGIFAPVNYMLHCELEKPNGTKLVMARIFTDGPRNNATETFSYTIPALENSVTEPGGGPSDPIQRNQLWYINSCALGMEPLAAACADDGDCIFGQRCDLAAGGAGNCRDIVFQTNRKPLYVHHNEWTLFNSAEDFYQAVRCYTKLEGQYFNNAHQCDFRGDAIFSMAMSKGIPIERECGNFDGGVPKDDDLNGLPNCLDPFCRTTADFCLDHPALVCDWGNPGNLGQCESVQYKYGDLCCTRQSRIVSGLECRPWDPEDGYYDCTCIRDELGNPPAIADDVGSGSGISDCVDPYYSPGDLCCTSDGRVIKASAQ